MKNKSINDNSILHIVIGIFVLVQILIYIVGFFSTDDKVFFAIFIILNIYLCFFHIAYGIRMIKNKKRGDNSKIIIDTKNEDNTLTVVNEKKKNEETIIYTEKDDMVIPDTSEINNFFRNNE